MHTPNVTLKYDGCPWKTTEHPFYATLSFVHHFKAIRKLKLKVTVWKRSIGVKIGDFFVSCDLEIWQMTLFCDLQIWRMTLKNNRAPLLRYFKLCALSYSPETFNSGQNRRFFCPVWPSNLIGGLAKQQGTSTMLLQAMCIISYPSVNSNWSYSPETPNLGQNRCFFSPVWL